MSVSSRQIVVSKNLINAHNRVIEQFKNSSYSNHVLKHYTNYLQTKIKIFKLEIAESIFITYQLLS